MGSYAIRTRLRSPNTLFSFRMFPQNRILESANGVHVWVDVSVNCDISVKFHGFESVLPFKGPLRTHVAFSIDFRSTLLRFTVSFMSLGVAFGVLKQPWGRNWSDFCGDGDNFLRGRGQNGGQESKN